MYESPIDIIYSEMQTKLEGKVFKAVQNVGINVNKDELIKALSYDRQQYEKGYADAKAEQQWIPVTERLPEDNVRVLCVIKETCRYDDVGEVEDTFICEGLYNGHSHFKKQHGWYKAEHPDMLTGGHNVIAWMPLPEPWEGGAE